LVGIYNYVKLHRQSYTKSGGGGKWTCFSCQRFYFLLQYVLLLVAQVYFQLIFALTVCHLLSPFRVGFLKGFYTIFNPAVGDVRAKNSEKNQKSRQEIL